MAATVKSKSTLLAKCKMLGRGAHTDTHLCAHEGTGWHAGKTVSLTYFIEETFCSQE